MNKLFSLLSFHTTDKCVEDVKDSSVFSTRETCNRSSLLILPFNRCYKASLRLNLERKCPRLTNEKATTLKKITAMENFRYK